MPLADRIHILGASGSGTTSLAIAVAARNIATVIWTPTTSSGCEPIQTHAGKRVVFEFEDVFAGRRQSLRSELYLFPFVGAKCVVKYRFTYRKALDVSKQTEELIRSVPWTATRL